MYPTRSNQENRTPSQYVNKGNITQGTDYTDEGRGLRSKKQGTESDPGICKGWMTTMTSLERQREQVVVPRSRAGVTHWRLELWQVCPVEAGAKIDIRSM